MLAEPSALYLELGNCSDADLKVEVDSSHCGENIIMSEKYVNLLEPFN